MTSSSLVLNTAAAQPAAGRSSGEDDFTISIQLILFNCTSHVFFKILPLKEEANPMGVTSVVTYTFSILLVRFLVHCRPGRTPR